MPESFFYSKNLNVLGLLYPTLDSYSLLDNFIPNVILLSFWSEDELWFWWELLGS